MRLINANNILYKDLNADMPQSKVRVWVTFKEWIDAMPTVEERKDGKWVWDDEGYHCSECFFHAYGNTLECMNRTYKYCPNCGAKMEVEHDGTGN